MDDTDREGEIEIPVAVRQGGSIVYAIGYGQAAPSRDLDAFAGNIDAGELAEMGGQQFMIIAQPRSRCRARIGCRNCRISLG